LTLQAQKDAALDFSDQLVYLGIARL